MKNRIIILILAFLPILFSCKKDNNPSADSNEVSLINDAIYQIFHQLYYWYDKVPEIDPATYTDPFEYFDANIYKSEDKWSWMATVSDFLTLISGGSSAPVFGFRFSFSDSLSNYPRIAYVHTTTEMYSKGVRRGWQIYKVSGIEVTENNFESLLNANSTLDFEFINNNNETVGITLTRSYINESPILASNIIEEQGKKIGYIMFNDFISDLAYEALDSTFKKFYDTNIDELVVDLRYNPGGSINVASYMASLMKGSTTHNDPLSINMHNDLQTKENDTAYFYSNGDPVTELCLDGTCSNTRKIYMPEYRLNLNRFIFITSHESASASELLINGLKPYVNDIIVVGSPTSGKTYGMNPYTETDGTNNYEPEYVMLAITFKYFNAQNEDFPITGIVPQISAEDDLTHDFGDPNEASLRAALDYIQTGIIKKSATPIRENIILGPQKPSLLIRDSHSIFR